MPKFHDNQLVILTTVELDELAGMVTQASEMEPVFDLAALRARYKVEDDDASVLWKKVSKVEGDLKAANDTKETSQARHNRMSDEVRASERRNFEIAMGHKGISELRAVHGKRTEKVVRDMVVDMLRKNPDYAARETELTQLQGVIELADKTISNIEKALVKMRKQAQAASDKAGETLRKVRMIEGDLKNG